MQTNKIARNVVTFVRRMPGEKAVMQASEDLRLRVWGRSFRFLHARALLHGFCAAPSLNSRLFFVTLSLNFKPLVTLTNQ